MSRRFIVPRYCLVVLLAVAAGCKPSGPPLAPVQGKVTVDGQSVTSGQVSYLTTDATNTAGLSAGKIDSNGEYTIYTSGQSGAPLGKYKVTVTPSMVPTQGATGMPSTPINAQYQDQSRTPLTKEVVANAAAGAYDLPLTK
jgi:hypothetical protein